MLVHTREHPAPPKRVILLGSRGFIGAAIHKRLVVDKFNLLAFTSADVDLSAPSAVDRLAAALRPDDAIVMLAALTPDKGRDIATLMKSLAMMQNVCAALQKAGCAQLIYFSSDAVYPFDSSPVTEATPASPTDLYGAMHHTREIMAHSLTGIPVLVLRPTLVYGLDDTHNLYGPNRFRRSAAKDRKIHLFGDGEETRDHIHVDDVAEITVRCLSHASTGVLNLATGRSTSFHEVAELVAQQFPYPVEIEKTSRANPVTHRHYDVANLVEAFPDFPFTILEDGVARIHREMTRGL